MFVYCFNNVFPMSVQCLVNFCTMFVNRSICPMQQKGTPPAEKAVQVHERSGIVVIYSIQEKENVDKDVEGCGSNSFVSSISWDLLNCSCNNPK